MTVDGEGLEYWLCDVFTDRQLAGNQLAVFADAGHLSTEQMQAIAREMNLSETTFLIRREEREEREQGMTVRIFTVQEELPFAGHPTLGTASMIREYLPFKVEQVDGRETVVLNLKAGKVPVRFESGSRFGEMTQPNPSFGALHDAALVAKALGLKVEDLAPSMPIQTTSTSVPFVIVPLASVDVLSRCECLCRLRTSIYETRTRSFSTALHAKTPMGMETNGARACSSTTVKILRRDRLRVARFRTWFDMDLWHRMKRCTFDRALRWEGRAIYTCARIAKAKV